MRRVSQVVLANKDSQVCRDRSVQRATPERRVLKVALALRVQLVCPALLERLVYLVSRVTLVHPANLELQVDQVTLGLLDLKASPET